MVRGLAVASLMYPELGIRSAVQLQRDGRLAEAIGSGKGNPVLLIANPHALHAPMITEGERVGFKAVIVEKPACVSPEQVDALKRVQIPVSVCHGYRVMWGPRTIRDMILANELGSIIAVDARWWQAVAAERALDTSPAAFQLWKNDPALSGPFDVLIDNGSHWIDLAIFLLGEPPIRGTVWSSYVNAEAAHRDTHIHLDLVFSGARRARASLSKTVHGTTSHLEFTVIGSRRSATWRFLQPDVIEIGDKAERKVMQRQDATMGSMSRPVHGLGWIEGYVEIISQTLLGLAGKSHAAVPTLAEGLRVMETIFSLERVPD